MRASRLVLAASLAVSVVLAAANVHARRGGGAGLPAPSSGRLLAEDTSLAAPFQRVAVISGAALDVVRDIDIRGDTAYLLGRSEWYAAAGKSVRGPFGSVTRGSPNYIAGGEQIVANAAGVFVLDRIAGAVLEWSHTGDLEARYSLPAGSMFVLQEMIAERSGMPLVLAQQISTDRIGDLFVLRLRGEHARADTLSVLPAPASRFTIPRLAWHEGMPLIADPVLHTLRWIGLDGAGIRTVHRLDPPLWETSQSMRDEFAARIKPPTEAIARALVLPDTFPSLRSFAVTASGRLVMMLDPGVDRVAFELFDAGGAPIGRIPVPSAEARMFLTRAGIVRLDESLSSTEVHLSRIP